MATFFFRAVASDGKVRSGRLTGENERIVARELRKQGLTPVYVGVAPKGTSFEIKLPSFGKGRRKDVLFFTQELAHAAHRRDSTGSAPFPSPAS